MELDGETIDRKIRTIVMSNRKYGGGGMLVTPHADPMNGFLDITIIDDLSKTDLLWPLPRIYRGTHLTHPKVTVRRVKEITVRSHSKCFSRPMMSF